MLLGVCAPGWAQLPDLYKKMVGAVWVVKNASQAEAAWRKVGLGDIHEQVRITVDGRRRLGARLVTGWMGRFAVEIIQPDAGDAVYGGFLKRHGDGVFAVLYAAPDRQQMEQESTRLATAGARVLRTLDAAGSHYTFFDTEPEGKYVLGLVSPPPALADSGPAVVTHLGLVIRKAAPVSQYWQELGFPEISLGDATPRPDGRYHGKPLLLPFGVGWQGYSHPTFEWIIPPSQPPNCYNDFLSAHGEGVQHMGLPVANLDSELAIYRKLGWSPVQSGAWGDVGKPNSGRYAYLNTDQLGVSLELIQVYR
jgi:hypothetical protein